MAPPILPPVQRWLDEVVIGLNLCPFAAAPRHQDRIRLIVSQAVPASEISRLSADFAADFAAQLLAELQAELRLLDQRPPSELETTLLIVPQGLEAFADYNDFLALADQFLEQFGWAGRFQIASFHPDYCFADTDPGDAENLTNRSPYPLLHLLREASIEAALADYGEPDQIPQRNIRLMGRLSKAQRQRLFPYLS
ncbi:MAG: DUF1415 domain-containing protein [Synechococcales cyanobacterium RM1_1_8]|nr:DUF1415 domain-containing protein [Synechococcales cyanobacterium RM1_1_8]